MNTHDKIELPPLLPADRYFEFDSHRMKASIDIPYWGEKSLEAYARAAIEADRRRRGEPVAYGIKAVNTGEIVTVLYGSDVDQIGEYRADLVVPLYTAPQPSEPVKVNAIFEIEDGECIGTTNAKVKRVEVQDDGVLTVVIDHWPKPVEPVSQHPDDVAVDAFATAMKAKLAKKRSEGRGGWQECSAEYLSDLLRSHVEKGDPVDVANLAMMLHQNGQGITPAEPVTVLSDADILDLWTGDPTHSRPAMGKNKVIAFARAILARYGQHAQPTKSSLKVSYDKYGDCLYVVCDSNEPALSDEDDKGILYRRAISDGRLVGITILDFMGRHAESSGQSSELAELERKTDLNNKLSSWSDEDLIRIFHERPDLADRLRKIMGLPAGTCDS